MAEPAAANDPGLGALLRQARLRRGLELGDAAATLRIRTAYLAAIEAGRWQELPGTTYATGFIRAYADYLDLDSAEIVRRFRQQSVGGMGPRTELVFPSPSSEGRIPGGAVLFLALVLSALAYGGWYYLSARDGTIAELVPALPERFRSLIAGEERSEPKVEAAVREVVPPAEETAEERPVAEVPAAKPAVEPRPPPRDPVAAAAQPVELKPAPPPAEPPAPPEVNFAAVPPGRVFGQNNGDARVVLRAVGGDSWIRVRGTGGQILMDRTLQKGDAYLVPNRPGLTLMTGNAGNLEVVVDGRATPSLGGVGIVRRDITLDPDKLAASH